MNPTHFMYLFLALVLSACSSSDDSSTLQKGEYIYRKHEESLFAIAPQTPNKPEPYPWEQGQVGDHLKITKEFFRCKGSSLNPPRSTQEKGETVQIFDCGGAEKHSLPLRENKEFIYPILIDIMNYVQAKTNKKVVITSGHRCPDHNSFVDSSPQNLYSKHMIGAEVSFYVQGMENRPDQVIALIQKYYKETPKYDGKKEYVEFKRYDKNDSGVSTLPWLNKEIFVKLFHKKEGRNFDNRHPYPYISIQVRYDWDLQEKVIYTWEKATRNYLRY